ncbi:MAG: tetraacyldisaccharide 4'-kinase [Candidatus Scalindua rubra]|uniref:Tetraacyldisaccharide 4'-kinase n=1 Tax=Candidatus Scalindua rubra TaxID=1872076 RepID=A0A1E3XAE5_9BACT|nr:MAG: tetraacyldisaccharide 4'-kinase [Candidatus Scalindua rubra]
MEKEYYLSILSGQQRGFLAALIRSSLSAFTYPYLVVLNTRNFLYRNGIAKSKSLPVKVISIGNITTGGTGKTPLVEYLARYLHKSNKKVAILSRGYGDNNLSMADDNMSNEDNNFKKQHFINDEYLILRENLKDVPVLLGKDRVKNGEKAIRDHDVDCLILDDGFQHLRIKRDLDIVVIDSLNPFGGEVLIPRGSLREPLKNLKRADLFVLSHCNQTNEHNLKSIYAKLHHINIDTPICESIHKPLHIENIRDSSILEPELLKGKRIYGLSAIGNPESFAFTLKELGADLIKHRVFHDHHTYTQSEIDEVISDAKTLGTDAILVTQKDIVKIRNMNTKDANILSLKIEIQITKGMEFYEEYIRKKIM